MKYACLKDKIFQALASLPPRHRAALVQRYFLGMNEEARPSPDGRQILYRLGERWFLIRDPSTTPERLIPASESISNPVWSPDSQWVALTDATEDAFPLLTLLNPETCQFARWSYPLNGVLTSWSR